MSNDLINATENFLSKISNLDGISSDIISQVIATTIKTYQDKVNVGIQDSISDLLDTFKQRIAETVFETSKQWKLPRRDLLLFPKNCRFCYQKGDSTVVLIEQDPQIRSLVFQKSLLSADYAGLYQTVRIPLALPNVVFLLHFRKKKLVYVFLFFTHPLLAGYDTESFCIWQQIVYFAKKHSTYYPACGYAAT